MKRFVWTALSVALCSPACGGKSNESSSDDGCTEGTEGCPCFGNDTCDEGLACYSSFCVDDGSAGTGGSSGSSTDTTNGGATDDATSSSGGQPGQNGTATGGSTSAAEGGATSTSTTSTAPNCDATGTTYAFFDAFECGADQWTFASSTVFALETDGATQTLEGSTATTTTVYATAGESTWTNLRLEVDVKAISFGTNTTASYVGVFGHFVDAGNYHGAVWPGSGYIGTSDRTNGGGSDAYSELAANAVAVGEWHTLRLDFVSDAIDVYLDGARVYQTSMNTGNAGGIALGARNATARFDNVRVTLL